MWPPSQKKLMKQILVCGSVIYYKICSWLIQAVIIRTAQDMKMKVWVQIFAGIMLNIV